MLFPVATLYGEILPIMCTPALLSGNSTFEAAFCQQYRIAELQKLDEVLIVCFGFVPYPHDPQFVVDLVEIDLRFMHGISVSHDTYITVHQCTEHLALVVEVDLIGFGEDLLDVPLGGVEPARIQ